MARAWCRWYEDLPTHPKTRAAARVLSEGLELPQDYAEAVVVRAVGNLVTWALRLSDTGRTAQLDDFELVAIAWPAALRPGGALWGIEDVGVLRRALRTAPPEGRRGFLWDRGRRQGSPGVEHVADFHEHAWDVLRDRPHYQGTRLAEWRARERGDVVENDAPVTKGARRAAEEAPRSAGSAGEVGETFGGGAVRGSDVNRWPDLAPSARTPRESPASLSLSRESVEGKDLGAGKEDPETAKRWRGIPKGVRKGEPFAVASWIRTLTADSRAGLGGADVYRDRWQTMTREALPREALDQGATYPGRMLEVLLPSAFSELVSDLADQLAAGKVGFPRTYIRKSLARRWTEELGKAADAAAQKRAQQRERFQGGA